MNPKRILLAGIVLALTVGCTWAASEAGFAVVPDNEAAQILGGLGWTCTHKHQDPNFYPCGETEEDCSAWVIQYETWECEVADSGQCDDSGLVIGFSWGACAWDPEFESCFYDGPGYDVPVNGC